MSTGRNTTIRDRHRRIIRRDRPPCGICGAEIDYSLHHTDPKNTFYCPITNLLNPALEIIGLWPKLEAVIEALTGATHRKDASNRGEGPAPAWVAELRRPSPAATPTSPRGPGNCP